MNSGATEQGRSTGRATTGAKQAAFEDVLRQVHELARQGLSEMDIGEVLKLHPRVVHQVLAGEGRIE